MAEASADDVLQVLIIITMTIPMAVGWVGKKRSNNLPKLGANFHLLTVSEMG